MAELNLPEHDLTLMELDKILEKKHAKENEPRKYLGMSQIGEPCRRKLFYSFRAAENKVFSAQGVKAVEDGFLQEDVMAERLRLLPFIELHTVDPVNPESQIGFSMLLDHFGGHCDGMIRGVIEAPKTWHVWEHKSVNPKKFDLLKKIRLEKKEKNALREWDGIYYDQAIIYMHNSKTERHYLTVTTPGGRDYISVRTDYNKKEAEAIIEKAQSIIFDNWVIPARLSEKREYYLCKWCDYQEICFDGRFPQVNCKTCRYSVPVKNGELRCELIDGNIEDQTIFWGGCNQHIYNPALISCEVIEQQQKACIYQSESGVKWANAPRQDFPDADTDVECIYDSNHLRNVVKFTTNITHKKIEEREEESQKVVKEWNKKGLKL